MSSRYKEFIVGSSRTLPLLLGALPFGLIYGALGISSGLSKQAVMAMSALVFAGSAQFIAAGLFGLRAPLTIILIVTFVVNLRHMLYSLSLLPYLKHLPQKWRIPLAFWLTDETYAVTIYHYQGSAENDHKHWFQLGSSVAMYLNWQLWTFVGIYLGDKIPNTENWGLDVAMPIAFIGMIIPFVNSASLKVCVATTGVFALLTNGLPYKSGLILSTLIGISAGIISDYIRKQRQVKEMA